MNTSTLTIAVDEETTQSAASDKYSARFMGKVERMTGERKTCRENGDCLNYFGSMIVPKGLIVTLFDQAKFKGDRMVIDARTEEVRVASFLNLTFEGHLSTTNKAVNWRESVKSIRIGSR